MPKPSETKIGLDTAVFTVSVLLCHSHHYNQLHIPIYIASQPFSFCNSQLAWLCNQYAEGRTREVRCKLHCLWAGALRLRQRDGTEHTAVNRMASLLMSYLLLPVNHTTDADWNSTFLEWQKKTLSPGNVWPCLMLQWHTPSLHQLG